MYKYFSIIKTIRQTRQSVATGCQDSLNLQAASFFLNPEEQYVIKHYIIIWSVKLNESNELRLV